MGRIFNQDGPFFVFMSKVADLMILNILFILCCIPVFTIGASLTGLSYVTLKMVEKSEGYIWKAFFKSFRENFKQATAIWLMLLAMGAVLYLDLRIARSTEGMMGQVFTVIVMVGVLIWFFLVSYAFPILARFVNTVRGTLYNAIMMSISNLPRTILMTAAVIGAILLTFLNTQTFVWGILLWLMFGFSALSYLNSLLQVKMFHRFMPEEPEESVDTWEMPED